MFGFASPVFILQNASRWDVHDAYLKNRSETSNLRIVSHAHVTKILFDDAKRASGVKFEKDGGSWIAKTKKEIIICAGAIGSPHLLMLSGIGPEATLQKFKIPNVHALPGVGQNLKDHVVALGMTYTVNPDAGFLRSRDLSISTMQLWETQRQGPLTVPVRCEGLAFLNSHFNDPQDDFPDLEIVCTQPPGLERGMKPDVVKRAMVGDPSLGTVMFMPTILRPKSAGYVSLRSADSHDSPVIQPRYLVEPEDVEVLLDALKFAHALSQTEPFRKLGMKPLPKPLFGCEEFRRFSDDYFRCQIRHYTSNLFHPMGTCKMGPQTDRAAVVDSRLRVHGVSHLRVIDASIMPTPLSAHTMAPSIMIGEKGAAFIIDDWASKRDEL